MYLPIQVKLKDRPVLVVGGGKAAFHRLRALKMHGAIITVISPEFREDIDLEGVEFIRRNFTESDTDGFSLVYACTDDRQTNREIANAARKRGAWVSSADDPDNSDFVSPASLRIDNMTVSVGSDAKDVKKSIFWRDMIKIFVSEGLHGNHRKGEVKIVGFGPGDALLLTLRGLSLLGGADVIFYDDLLDSGFVQMFPAQKEWVGKRKASHSAKQEEINHLLHQSAIEGNKVVRLKGGDPGIFGRVGEEVSYLSSRGIPVEIIPGVTAASAAAASAGIALTQRGISRSCTLAAAHGPNWKKKRPDDDETLVYYMGASKLDDISEELIRAGTPPDLPVIAVESAGSERSKVSHCTLQNLPFLKAESPLILILGNIAKQG